MIADEVKLRATVKVICRIGKRVVATHEFPNKVTDLGATLFALLISGSGTKPTHMGIGTDYTAAAAGDTVLGAQVARVALVATTPGTKLVQWTVTFAAGVATGTLREIGLFNASSGGTMSNRAVFSTPLVKTADMSIDVVWQMTLSN
jgi:hypothetical protein